MKIPVYLKPEDGEHLIRVPWVSFSRLSAGELSAYAALHSILAWLMLETRHADSYWLDCAANQIAHAKKAQQKRKARKSK